MLLLLLRTIVIPIFSCYLLQARDIEQFFVIFSIKKPIL